MTPRRLRRWVNMGLVLAAVASVGAAVVTRRTWSSSERLARSNHLVVGYRSDEIRRITLLSGGAKLVLARGDGERRGAPGDDGVALGPGADDVGLEHARWQFVAPYQGEADEAAVDALLRAIEFAPFLRKVDDSTLDRRAAGFDSPEQTIELEMGQVRTRLHVGASAPTPPGARYVEIGGEGTANKGVYVVSETTAKELMVRPEVFRVRQVVPYGATSLAKVTLRHGSAEVVLAAATRGDWRLERDGKRVRLDRDAVQRLFGTLARSRAEQFVSDASKLEASPASVEATFVPQPTAKSGDAKASVEPLRVRFGGVCPTDPSLNLAVTEGAPPLGACTVPLHLETFVAGLPELVDRHLFGQHLDAVEELQVKAGERTLELARRQEGWAMRSPQAGLVEPDVGDGFVSGILDAQGELTVKPDVALTELATVSLLEAHAAEQEAPRESVTVFVAEQPAGATGEAPLFVHRSADDAWLRLSARHRRLFTPNMLLLKATQLLSLDAGQVTNVRVQTSSWTQAFTYAGQPPACEMLAPSGYQADGALCLDVIDELRVLRAKRWVAERDTGGFGLESPALRVTFTVDDKSSKPPTNVRSDADQAHGDHAGPDHAHGEAASPVADGASSAHAEARQRTLLIGDRAPDGAYHAQLAPDPAVFTLRPSAVEALSTLVVDRAPFLFDAQSVVSVAVRTPSRQLSLRRLGDELVGAEVADKVALLDALAMVRPEAAVALLKVGQPAVAPDVYGFGKPLLDVTVTRRVDDAVRVFRWLVGRGDVYRDVSIFYAMPVTSEPGAVFALPREVVQRILDAL